MKDGRLQFDPGTPEARIRGCSCPTHDEAPPIQLLDVGATAYTIDETCPLHGLPLDGWDDDDE